MKTEANLWPQEGEHGSKAIWLTDPVFDQTWPIFDSKFDED